MASRKSSRPLTAQEWAQKLTLWYYQGQSISLDSLPLVLLFSFFFFHSFSWKARTEEEFHSRHKGMTKLIEELPESLRWSNLWFICPFGTDRNDFSLKLKVAMRTGGHRRWPRMKSRKLESSRRPLHVPRRLRWGTRPTCGQRARPCTNTMGGGGNQSPGANALASWRSLAKSRLCLYPQFSHL